jgi:hypothetical protein
VKRGDDEQIVETLKRAMANDGSSVSAWFAEKAREWHRAHAPGNPQTPLERYDIRNQKPPSEWTLLQLEEKQRGEDRWAKLHSLTNEELIARQAKISEREGYYLEVLEISLILTHRRLAPSHGPDL